MLPVCTKVDHKTFSAGFTFIEAVITAAIFLIVVLGIYGGYSAIIRIIGASRYKTDAMLLANEQIEVIRNLSYADVGILNGVPAGKIPRVQTFVRDGITYTVTASVRNTDDPFDGTLGGTYNDTAPSDYKKVELDIECSACRNFPMQKIDTIVAPKNLETATGNGALFVNVLDASGNPVANANVHIENKTLIPNILIDEVTNNAGVFQLIDTPPGNQSYLIRVSKNGYSTSQTYPLGATGNPNPVDPNLTVAGNRVTQKSLMIDKLANLNIHTLDRNCRAVGSVGFQLTGSKLIGSSPDVHKYDQSLSTNGSGNLTLPAVEWDTYTVTPNSPYVLAGSLPLVPISIAPGATQDLSLVLASSNPNNLLVTVRDASTKLPLASSTVSISMPGFSDTQTTSRGFFLQSDWSGGAGQTLYADKTKYSEDDTNIDVSLAAGQVSLRQALDTYVANGTLTSSLFDTGGAGTTYYTISWQPGSQATSTGDGSVRIQIASGNDPATTTWNYLGPDGTAGSYYTVSGSAINSIHNGDRYVRYKVYLSTLDQTVTPILTDVSLTYSSACLPFGQTFWSGLGTGSTTITVSHAGYQDYSTSVGVNSSWQNIVVDLNPS